MFKNLNQLKKNIEVGQKVVVNNRLKNVKEERIVLKKQTNGIYTGKKISKEEYFEKKADYFGKNGVVMFNGDYYTNIYMPYEKASNTTFIGNVIQFLSFDKMLSYGAKVRYPSLDFETGEPWLELIF